MCMCGPKIERLRNVGVAHLSALLDLLPTLAQPGQIHLALSAHIVLLKLGDPHSCHIVCLGDDSDLGLFHSRQLMIKIQILQLPSPCTSTTAPLCAKRHACPTLPGICIRC